MSEPAPSGPIRMCVICRQRFEVGALLRHVVDHDGVFRLDDKKKSPGRGWYCCRKCVARFANFKPKAKRARKKCTGS